MKAALVFLCLIAAAVAEAPFGGYSSGRPQAPSGGDTGYGAPEHTPQTFKNVYVYSAPDEPEDRQARTIRVPGGDKHVNIIFVKTPSSSSSHQTEVILPEQDEHKNLVYVLLKKGENSADVKITRPQGRPQPKPEVNFIRYGSEQAAGYSGNGASSAGAGAPVSVPSSTYGQPSF
ncbi:uncharacterized protein LOC110844725 [Folsomia candida]|uniref:DUF243 domain-containing protein n=1 Tax=Folsomia candida TaxID=158441 RepID=A0A226ES90_FOLCA|nr:uncharacterized protein LOC110844725 [Folsomia candida]OXA59934.1 hypothetical protein Fcan01_04285 [Folsomia candida]